MTIALTFLPGTMCDWRVWAPVWAELGDDAATGYVALETQRTRDRMRALIAMAGDTDGPLHLIGFSMGGYFALEYALEQPANVASLVMVCASAFGLTPAELAERQRAIEYLSTHDYHGMTQSRLNQFVHPTRNMDPAVAGVMRAMDKDLGKEVLLGQLKETSRRVDLGPRLGELAMPVLLLGADADNFSPPPTLEKMAGFMPDARLAVAANGGHMITLEQPAWVAAQLNSFYGV